MDEREHYRQLAEVTPSHPWDSTVAILIRRGNQLAQHGTGTLFSIGEDAFLVTAAHVVQSAKDTDAALYVATPERAFLQLVGNCFLSADEDGADVLDVALFSLNGALKQAFRSARWLRLSDVSIDFDVPSAVYCVYGYPAIWTHKSDTNPSSLDTRPLQYATYTYDDSTSALKDFDDRFHIALAASLDDTRDENATPVDFSYREGVSARFPGDLGGISGGSVWLFGGRRKSLDTWSPEEARMVGVETCVYNTKGIIRATRWSSLAGLIYKSFPKTRPVFELHGMT